MGIGSMHMLVVVIDSEDFKIMFDAYAKSMRVEGVATRFVNVMSKGIIKEYVDSTDLQDLS